MRDARQRYYAALEHEHAAQRLFEAHQDGSAAPGAARPSGFSSEETPSGILGVPAPEEVYSELGMRVYRALETLIGNLAGWGRSGAGDGSQLRRVLAEALQPLSRDMDSLVARLERHDALLNEIVAGIRRIDRFTLDAFQRLRGRGGYLETGGYGEDGARGTSQGEGDGFASEGRSHARSESAGQVAPKRLAKEETVARALEAARRLRSQGRKLTLKSVAEAAGLKYSQIVYAFGSKEELLERVTRTGVEVANAS